MSTAVTGLLPRGMNRNRQTCTTYGTAVCTTIAPDIPQVTAASPAASSTPSSYHSARARKSASHYSLTPVRARARASGPALLVLAHALLHALRAQVRLAHTQNHPESHARPWSRHHHHTHQAPHIVAATDAAPHSQTASPPPLPRYTVAHLVTAAAVAVTCTLAALRRRRRGSCPFMT